MTSFNIPAYFIITPSEELVMLLDKYNYPQDRWREKMIWEIRGGLNLDEPELARERKYVKIAFLLDIILTMRVTAIKEKYSYIAHIVHEIFGNPPHYDITILEKWWIIERTTNFYTESDSVKRATSQDFQQIKKTGNGAVDAWLDEYANSEE